MRSDQGENMRARPAKSYAIHDPKVLREVVTALIKRLGDGSEPRTAELLGLSQPTLNRYRNQKRRTISRRIVRAIARAVDKLQDERLGERLTEAILKPEAAEIIEHWTETIRSRLEAVKWTTGSQWHSGRDLSKANTLGLPFGSSEPHEELEYLVWRMRTQTPTLFAKLDKALSPLPPGRARFSALRILEPLLDHSRTGRVERGAEELTPEEFAQFVRAGIARELILLRRGPDAWRAMCIAEGFDPPEPADPNARPGWAAFKPTMRMFL
jgi:predicted transcriptional regulator